MSKEAHKKPVTVETPPELVGDSTPTLNQNDFDDALFAHGYDCHVEKALPCPCRDGATKSALSSCGNCNGVGWIFVEKKSTKLVIQSMNRMTKYQNWSEDDRGTISISGRGVDRLAFMDRITVLDLLSIYAEVARVRRLDNKLFAYTIYSPVTFTEVYLFEGDSKALTPLSLLTDYTIVENRLILADKYKNKNLKEMKLSLRYLHFPQYNVVDITREITANKGVLDRICDPNASLDEELAKLPLHVVGRKTHYVLDAPSVDGVSVFDNTAPKDPNQTLLESTNVFSLLFFILRSSPEQIDEALRIEDDSAKITELIALLSI